MINKRENNIIPTGIGTVPNKLDIFSRTLTRFTNEVVIIFYKKSNYEIKLLTC